MGYSLLLAAGVLSVGLAIVFAVAAVGVEVRERAQVERNLRILDGSGVGMTVKAPVTDTLNDRVFKPAVTLAIKVAKRMSGSEMVPRTQERLDLAGNPGNWDVNRILAAKTGCLVALGALGALIGTKKPAFAVFLIIGFAAAGFFLPDVLLKNAGLKWQETIQRTLPDSIDMLTISVEAGLAFDAALSQVAQHSSGPVAAEFGRVLQEMRIGKSRGQAFRSLQGRTTVPEFRAFVAAIVQADAFGIPIANVLRSQSKEMRLKRRQRAEEKAQKVPLKIMIPVVCCIFPALFVVVLAPGILGALDVLHHH